MILGILIQDQTARCTRTALKKNQIQLARMECRYYLCDDIARCQLAALDLVELEAKRLIGSDLGEVKDSKLRQKYCKVTCLTVFYGLH